MYFQSTSTQSENNETPKKNYKYFTLYSIFVEKYEEKKI